MSASAAPIATSAETPVRKRKSKLPLIIVGVVFTAAGAAFPMVVDVPALFAKNKSDKGKAKSDIKTAIVPFSDVVVNLSEEKMTRYLRLKIAVTVDADREKDVTQELNQHKAAIKSKIISHVAGKTLKDVSGSVGVTRLQRELLEKFEDELYPDGNSPIRAVLFEEYVIQ
jgi:flagellar basal body-associated protein FliL